MLTVRPDGEREEARMEIVMAVWSYIRDLLMLPILVRRILVMAGMTEAALAELSSAVDEVASEIEAIASDSVSDSATADRLNAVSARLRGLVPDEPTV